MTNALKVGIAGLGTVGSALFKAIVKRTDMLSDICGRPIEITAVCARDRSRDRGIDLSNVVWFDDPITLAGSGEIDVFVE